VPVQTAEPPAQTAVQPTVPSEKPTQTPVDQAATKHLAQPPIKTVVPKAPVQPTTTPDIHIKTETTWTITTN
jgi:hypothetical protein